MSCYMMAAWDVRPVSEILFLFFTGRGDSFLSPKRERKEWGRKHIRRGIQGRSPEPNCDPAEWSQFGKEEGASEYGAFGAPAEA